MAESRRRLANLCGLQQLYQTRFMINEARYHERKAMQEKAARSVCEREASISCLQEDRASLFVHLGRETVEKTPTSIERVHVRRYWVEYDLEKEEYYLEVDRQDLNEAESQLSQSRQELLRTRKRKQLVQQQLASLRREISRRDERWEMEN